MIVICLQVFGWVAMRINDCSFNEELESWSDDVRCNIVIYYVV